MDPNAEPNPNHPTDVPRIGVLTGYWSTNIGNAFFQLGAEYAINRAYPGAHVFLIGDQPGYWNTRKGNPANALDYVKHLDLDAVVVLGPYVRPEMEGITAAMLRAQHRKGAKIIVLAAGMMQYDKDTIALSRKLMSECPPHIFTTRDTETYEALGDLAAHAYDGVDVATFVSEVFPRVPTDLEPYMVLNFDQIPEPVIGPKDGFAGRVDRSFEFEGREWCVRQPQKRTEWSYRKRAYPFLDAMLFRSPRPERIDGRLVLRTDHRYNPFLMLKSYRSPNTYVGDIPHTYLSIYANSQLTISNRVHACVATVSYGNAAMLFTRSPRAYLLKRLGLESIKDRPQRVDLDFLRREKASLIAWLGDRLTDTFGPAPALAQSTTA
ncbi:MAG: polysaccharide pyruvyl transferase family protein [Phycisphaerales bacterium]|nr:polysaccharide pyruvyl transferase family protein [Planctomycetota bacterium]MCH8508060.1 polysaccharide pyruvyl transferase family protein [Phycisphaerales bacterium]